MTISKTMKKLFLCLALLMAPKVNAGFVSVDDTCIKTKHKAYGLVLSADSCDRVRFGAGLGFKGKKHEIHIGFHDNLLPYLHGSYKLEHIKSIADAYIETEDSEIKPEMIYGVGLTYLFTESWGIRLESSNKKASLGLVKWF